MIDWLHVLETLRTQTEQAPQRQRPLTDSTLTKCFIYFGSMHRGIDAGIEFYVLELTKTLSLIGLRCWKVEIWKTPGDSPRVTRGCHSRSDTEMSLPE